jgi:hypothetical protein
MDFNMKINDSCNLVNLIRVTYPIFLNQFNMKIVKKESTIKLSKRYIENLPYVYLKIQNDPTKNGPRINGNSASTFGFMGKGNHHHFLLVATVPSATKYMHIKSVPGKNLFNVFLLRSGMDNQGSRAINVISRFLFFIKEHPLHHSGKDSVPFS